MLRIPNCIDNRLTDGGEVVSLTRRPRSALHILIGPLSSVNSHHTTRRHHTEGPGPYETFHVQFFNTGLISSQVGSEILMSLVSSVWWIQ
jgi:hypothetical protein